MYLPVAPWLLFSLFHEVMEILSYLTVEFFHILHFFLEGGVAFYLHLFCKSYNILCHTNLVCILYQGILETPTVKVNISFEFMS